ncbi:uncharacterized protein LOC119337616 [Triticum dicoccoides]|uniref:uncharacterized protein LOC119337616 n=1 Tax=Triticum dicoccoides TaxID=85692 RepID=UPI001890F9C6|nr:uncharacterized protein LOC119337616 [Triticum dicoccoides]
MLTSLKTLVAEGLNGVVGLGGEGDVEWQHPVEHLVVQESRSASGKDLTELLSHLPRLSQLRIIKCEITQLAVGVDLQHTTSVTTSEVEQEKEDDGLLLFPAHLSDSLRQLVIEECPELVLVDTPSTSVPARGGGGLQALRSLQRLQIRFSPKFLLSVGLFSSPSLQVLEISGAEGMETLEQLSNLTSLIQLELWYCGEDLRCKGLGPLLTAGGQLRELTVLGSARFFAGWDHNPRRVLQDEGGEEQELQQLVSTPSSSKLHKLWTDDPVGLLAAPIHSFLSLTHMCLRGDEKTERFTKGQEDNLHLLASLQQLMFDAFGKLQQLPEGLHKLTNLNKLVVWSCPVVRSLPKDGLPKSLQELDVSYCGNEELKQ